jgi:hypothetical protein
MTHPTLAGVRDMSRRAALRFIDCSFDAAAPWCWGAECDSDESSVVPVVVSGEGTRCLGV